MTVRPEAGSGRAGPLAREFCAEAEPPLRPFSPGRHLAACHFPPQTPMSADAAPVPAG